MSSAKYFEQLPSKLRRFFARYPPSVEYESVPTWTTSARANPFLANKHPVTLRHHDPVYSLRRMSDLYKLAARYGVQDLLPPVRNTGRAFFEDKYNSKQFMRGVMLPKGHKHELRRTARDAQIAQALQQADTAILHHKGAKYAARLKRKLAETRSWV